MTKVKPTKKIVAWCYECGFQMNIKYSAELYTIWRRCPLCAGYSDAVTITEVEYTHDK